MKLSDVQAKAVESIKAINSNNDLFWDDSGSFVKFAKGTLSLASSDDPRKIAETFLTNNSELLGLSENLTEILSISTVEKDKQGYSHVSFSQTLNQIPVFEGSTQVHINTAGEVIAYKENRLANIDVSLEARLTEQNALDIVSRDCGIEFANGTKSSIRLLLFRDIKKEVHLAWEFEWMAGARLASSFHIVDAHTGDILLKHTHNRDAVSRMTYSANKSTKLRDKLLLEGDQVSSDKVAVAAHQNANIVYQYFLNTFGRNSYDGEGAALVSSVHYKKNYNNAFWTDYYKQMVYGDGDGNRFAPLALALDIVGHELAHAVSARTARFVYAEQAGALDESFADFFGVMVSNEGDIRDWKMGEGVFTPYRSGDALRDLSDPAGSGQPDHMSDLLELDLGEQPDPNKNDNGYVHSNSGIPNKAAYLTVAGGVHHGITVTGLGRVMTEQIYYLGMSSYLNSATDTRWTFKQARYALLNACRQLYGDAGNEYAAIKNAWAAVGVGEPDTGFSIIRKNVSSNLAIPDNEATGVESVLNIEDDGLLKDIYIGIDIEHSYIGDLRVSLISPLGETVVLHDRTGGSEKNIFETYQLASLPLLRRFVGDEVKGDWTLSISDNARVDTGKLIYWELEFSVQRSEKKQLSREISANLEILDENAEGIESIIQIPEKGKIVRLDVMVDITHTWIGDLRVVLQSPTGINVVLHDKSGRSRQDIKMTYSTASENPLLPLLNTEMEGNWRLKVIDAYAQDIGMLNSWGINCIYE